MAKMLKHLVFGQKKNPPAPPRPDYEGDKTTAVSFDKQVEVPFFDHDYENISKFKPKAEGRVHFTDKKETEQLVVFDNYSEPADLRVEISTLEADPLYMSPLDDQGTAPPLPPEDEEEEDMYCVPYDTPDEVTSQPCLIQDPDDSCAAHPEDSTYDVVPCIENEDEANQKDDDTPEKRPVPIEDEYDEPWEWSVGARLTNSLQVSPTPSLDDDDRLISDLEDEEAMTARQQRRLLYETAFDSRVKRDADDFDRLMQSPLFLNRAPVNESVARAASRSSFGSTSGSSASSTPTHQPMEIARQSPRHFTPTERRKVTLVRDGQPRSMSPQAKPLTVRGVVNQNFERKISFSSSNQWDDVSRCSGSEKSSSQESMNVELTSSKNERNSLLLGRSASRDSLSDDRRCNLTSNYPNNWKELTSAKLDSFQKEPISSSNSPEVKVLPTNHGSPCFTKTKSSKLNDLVSQDPELKENKTSDSHLSLHKPARPSNLLSEVKPMDNLPQSPENDERTSQDYDPPWDLKMNNVLRPSGVNGSVSVPERLSTSGQTQLPMSMTHDKLDVEEIKDRPTITAIKPCRPSGSSSRPILNLNLNSDSPRKARQNLMLNFGCAALSAVGEKVDPQLTLEKQGWYHGSISRVDAEGKLRVLKEGSYLVRNSESSKQDYSLSLKSARGFMHMKIVPTAEGRFILGQFSNPFSSIPEMIQHYSINKLPIKGAEHMSLLYPVIDQLL